MLAWHHRAKGWVREVREGLQRDLVTDWAAGCYSDDS